MLMLVKTGGNELLPTSSLPDADWQAPPSSFIHFCLLVYFENRTGLHGLVLRTEI
jgi:hypothetical protein